MKNKTRLSKSVLSVVTFALLLTYSVIIIFLLVWAIATSLKGRTDYMEHTARLFPNPPLFSNYINALKVFVVSVPTADGVKTVGLIELLFNSALYMFGTTFINLSVSLLVAYLTARYEYFFSKIVFFTVIFAMSFSLIATGPSAFSFLKSLKLYDNIFGIWLLNAGYLTGSTFLFFHAAAASIPKDLTDAARIDGASELRIMLFIGFPQCVKVFALFFMLGVIQKWNDYQTPMLYLPSHPTLAYGVFMYTGNSSSSISTVPERIVGAMYLLVPMLIIFLLFHKKLMGNVTVGGVKE